MSTALQDLPGLVFPKVHQGSVSTWYALVMRYAGEDLRDLDLITFYDALVAEACIEADRP